MDRVSAAKDRLRSSVFQMEELCSNPCYQCRFYEMACTHPAAADVRPDPVSGDVKIRAISAETARSPSGACGPEGALFEERSLPGQLAIWLLATTKGRLILGGGFLGFLLLS